MVEFFPVEGKNEGEGREEAREHRFLVEGIDFEDPVVIRREVLQTHDVMMGEDFAVIGNALPNSLHWRDAKKLRDAGLRVGKTSDDRKPQVCRGSPRSHYMGSAKKSATAMTRETAIEMTSARFRRKERR